MANYLYLNKDISKCLVKYNCPNIVFRKIWLYVPNNTKNEIVNLKEEICKEILLFFSKKNKCYLKYKSRLNDLLKIHKTYENILNFVILIGNDNNYKSLYFKNDKRLLTIGTFVHIRSNLRKLGILD